MTEVLTDELYTENEVNNVLIICRGYCGSVPEPNL